MLKVKKTIYAPSNKTKTQITELQNDIKESIKKIMLDNKNKNKTINDYAELIIKIRKEYEIICKENKNLKMRLQKSENFNERQQLMDYNKEAIKHYPKILQKRKRKYQQFYVNSSSDSTNSEDESSYYIYPKKKSKKGKNKKSKKICYHDIDGKNDYNADDDVLSSEKESEIENEEIVNNQKIKKANEKGITKSIKYIYFFFLKL